MNDYEISKLKKELQRKNQLLKEEQQDRQYTENQLSQVQAERDTYHSELLIARQQIENIDRIIADNVREMRAKLEKQNSDSLQELKQLRQKLIGQQMLNEKLQEENKNKDAVIVQLSGRLRQMSKKYKDPSLLVNTKQISEQATITHNQFYKLTEKYNKLSKDMENIMAENKILRKLNGVPDNFGFDLEEIKIAQKQQLQDYKAQCRKLQTQIQQLQAERTQLRYRLRQYNTLFSNKGQRYRDMNQRQLDLLDQYALKLKQGIEKFPQIDKTHKQMEKEIMKLRAQVQVLQNKAPISTVSRNNDERGNNQQLRKIEDQIKTLLEPFVKDIKKLSELNLNNLLKNVQSTGNEHDLSNQGFKGPIPLPIAHNDWSKIKEGYSFIYSSKIPVDLNNLDDEVSFDVMKARYEVAALQLQNIESLKLLKEKQKIETQLTNELTQLKQKFKKCLKVQDDLFIRYFKQKQAVNDKIKRLEIQKLDLKKQNQQLDTQYTIIKNSFHDLQKKTDIERRLGDYTERLAISQAQVLKFQRKYQILNEQQKYLRQAYTNLQSKTIRTQYNLKQKLIHAKNNERQLASLANQILDDCKDSVSADVHNALLNKTQHMNDKQSTLINKEIQLRLRIDKLQSLQRQATVNIEIIENLREDNMEVLLELEIVKNRLRTIDVDYRLYSDTFDRLVKYINENSISLMAYFKKFDQDGSGQLNKNQLDSSLKALGFKMTNQQLELLFGQIDLDGSGSVSYKEFIRKMRRGGAITRSQQQQGVLKLFNAIKHSKLSIKQAFHIIDADGSGAISKTQMQSALSKIGISTSAQTIDFIFKMCDFDGDNTINCVELEKLYKEMVKQSEVMDKQIYSEEIDWKYAFLLKIQEVSIKVRQNLIDMFKKLDQDGSLTLTMVELVEFVKRTGLQIQKSDLQQLFDFLDRRKDNSIQYGQFLKVLAQAKVQQKRIQRVKYIRERTKQLMAEKKRQDISKSVVESDINRGSESEKLKIRISALQTKQSTLLKKNEVLAKELAKNEQDHIQLKKTL